MSEERPNSPAPLPFEGRGGVERVTPPSLEGREVGGVGPHAALPVAFTINGQPWRGEVPVDEVLLDLVRGRLGLTGSKRSCESEVCGACTMLVDGQPVSACTYLAFEAAGKSITTVEGLAEGDRLHPLQEAFLRNVGAQCGYCTAGQLLMAAALLAERPAPTHADIAHWMQNTCRCGAYPAITQSILEAAAELRGS